MDFGKILIIFGTVILIVGIVFTIFPQGGLPKLPGDIYIKRDGFVFYFPVVTSLLISIILTIILQLFFRK